MKIPRKFNLSKLRLKASINPEMLRKNKFKIISMVLVLIGYLGILSLSNVNLPDEYKILTYNSTKSLTRGYYLLLPIDKNHLEKGTIVLIDEPKEIREFITSRGWITDEKYGLKRIGGVEGSEYYVDTSKSFIIDDEYIGKIYDADNLKRPMPSVISTGRHIVSKDHYIPVTRHPHSYDGRYYGELPIDTILKRAILILPTENPFNNY